ncbi:MAG: imidazolonepropionase, partial [Bacteroidales bacterium]|nr:imidazolonepropionase [Bacteroidales bacterium]
MLIINIKELVGIVEDGSLMKAGAAMSEVNRIENAFLYIRGKKIADYGKMDSPEYQQYLQKEIKVVDAKGGIVMPTFCDSHTHIVYANSREMEFVDKI